LSGSLGFFAASCLSVTVLITLSVRMGSLAEREGGSVGLVKGKIYIKYK